MVLRFNQAASDRASRDSPIDAKIEQEATFYAAEFSKFYKIHILLYTRQRERTSEIRRRCCITIDLFSNLSEFTLDTKDRVRSIKESFFLVPGGSRLCRD